MCTDILFKVRKQKEYSYSIGMYVFVAQVHTLDGLTQKNPRGSA
jgi:hypothetical protein